MGPLWIVTRPADEAAALVAELRERKIPARAVPVVVRLPLPWPAALAARGPARTLVLVTSAFVARRIVATRPFGSGGVSYAAMEPASAGVLRRAGIEPEVTASGGVVTLARKLAEQAGARGAKLRILYPTSGAGMERSEQDDAIALLSGHEVIREAVYALEPAPGIAEVLGAIREAYAVALFSPSAVQAFRGAARGARPPERALCVGRSTLDEWERARGGSEPAGIHETPGGSVADRIVELCDAA